MLGNMFLTQPSLLLHFHKPLHIFLSELSCLSSQMPQASSQSQILFALRSQAYQYTHILNQLSRKVRLQQGWYFHLFRAHKENSTILVLKCPSPPTLSALFHNPVQSLLWSSKLFQYLPTECTLHILVLLYILFQI